MRLRLDDESRMRVVMEMPKIKRDEGEVTAGRTAAAALASQVRWTKGIATRILLMGRTYQLANDHGSLSTGIGDFQGSAINWRNAPVPMPRDIVF